MSLKTLTVSVLSIMCLALPGAALAQSSDPVTQKIEPKVLSDLNNNGRTTFFVMLKEQADTSAARKIVDWKARGEYVVNTLKSLADRTQKPVLEMLSKKAGGSVMPFWISNTIQVTTSDAQVIQELAARTDVASLMAEEVWSIPEPELVKGDSGITPLAVGWNIAQIHANDVWNQYGVRGEGIVVANIDTGVQFDHPALMGKYRGLQEDGTFDHNYNWYDPAGNCPGGTPCDTDAQFGGHGTHTMGTMVGDDEAGNQIGAAPGARWIAAKACHQLSCSPTALMQAGQWMLAPTDIFGENPLPERRPHVINNSWGGSGGSFYRATVQNWRNAGIFPVFASGNPGSACGRASAPAIYPESFAVGATTNTDAIASFSGRGPAAAYDGITKPEATAPGQSIRSSLRGNRYGLISGTSMASPHVAGTVALFWSALPGLIGDIDSTFIFLEISSRFRSSTSCGPAGPPNNVYGWGVIDALAAVQLFAGADTSANE